MVIPIHKIALAFVVSFSCCITAFTQPSLQVNIDKKDILVGQQINLQVTANLPPQDFFVKWIEVPDSLQHFELVDKSKIDSVYVNQKLSKLSQTFTFTSFDSGKWILPSFDIHFSPSSGGEPYNFFTDSFSVNVSYQADSTTVLRDIKDIRASAPFSVWQYLLVFIIGFVVLCLLGWLIYFLIKRSRQKSQVAQPPLSAYQYAMVELDKIKQLNMQDAAAVKTFHTRLKEILKTYLCSIEGPDFISSTTGEIIMLLQRNAIYKTTVSKVSETLRISDAARFAKYIPSITESEQGWRTVKEMIDFIQQLQSKKDDSGS